MDKQAVVCPYPSSRGMRARRTQGTNESHNSYAGKGAKPKKSIYDASIYGKLYNVQADQVTGAWEWGRQGGKGEGKAGALEHGWGEGCVRPHVRQDC